MAKIIDIVRARKKELKANPVLAGQNAAMAIAAMHEGINSNAWQFYMSQFVDQAPPGNFNQHQLLRLTGRDNTQGDPILDRQRAYLIGNAMCTVSTTDDTDFGVDTIDYTLDTGNSQKAAFDCDTTTTIGLSSTKKGRKKAGKKAGKKYNKR